MTVLLIAAAAVASVLAARRWVHRPSAVRREQVTAFTRARAVTNTWSADPSTTPAPLREYLARQRRSPENEDPGRAEQG
ncbi:MAG TPA: hypothetical protein VMZ11_04755 [Mycobacteriales bacterium]|nr:hypothetical protein [Mycobacteriales bacterium]